MAKAHNIKSEVKKYMAVFYGLLVLTVVTVAISYLKVTPVQAVILALIVATFKASLVAGFFMHLNSEKKIIYVTLIFTMIFFFAILLLPILESFSVPEGTVNLDHVSSSTEVTHDDHGHKGADHHVH